MHENQAFTAHRTIRTHKRFELQLTIGQTPISEIYINPKSKNALDQLIAALKELYCDNEYNDRIERTEKNITNRIRMPPDSH